MAMATTPTPSCLTPSASNSSVSSSNRACADADNTTSDTFPAGLRVLVVDDDPICLLILDRMLRHCQYQVTTRGRAADALALLRQNRNKFDVIISDVYMPDMDGFKLLELVGLEMDLPVIMMSANGETSAVMKGIKHGACDYLLKPVRMEELRNIWQHVVRKKWRNAGQATSHELDRVRLQAADESEHTSSANEGVDGMWKQSKKRKETKEEEEEVDLDMEDPSSTKKPRVVWSVELHQQFVNAVNQLGIDKAVPKRILELMNVQGLTRENVASHLQKYRLYLKRISGVAHQSGGLNPQFSVTSDSNFGPVSAAGGLRGINDLRMLSGPSPQALVSSLQAGILGRLNTANLGMANVDPSVLLRLAALQGAGNGAVARDPTTPGLPSCGQLNVQESFQAAGPSDVNQLQVSQLGAFAGSLDKGTLEGLSTLQQQQLLAMASSGSLGPLPRVGNSQQVNASNGAFLMQGLQHQPVGCHLTSGEGSLPIPTSRMGLQEDMEPWAASPLSLTGQATNSVRLLSGSPLGGGASMLGLSGRGAYVDNNALHMANLGNVGARAVSSPLVSGGIDESTARISPPVMPPGDNMGRGFGSKFSLLSGPKPEQESYTGQRSQGPWQGLNISQDLGSLNERPRINQTLAAGQNQVHGHPCSQAFSSGRVSNSFSLDNARFNALPSMRDMQGEPLKAESSMKVKEEGQIWLNDPTSDELLAMVLKQQQERLGLADSELGGADCYTMNNMYVK